MRVISYGRCSSAYSCRGVDWTLLETETLEKWEAMIHGVPLLGSENPLMEQDLLEL